MSDEAIRLGDQSKTTLEQPAKDAALALIKNDVQKLAMALETLVVQMVGLKDQLYRIEKTLGEIAIGLGVVPK